MCGDFNAHTEVINDEINIDHVDDAVTPEHLTNTVVNAFSELNLKYSM